MKRHKYVLLVILALFGMGCEKPVSVNIPEHDRQIVTEALFAQDSLWHVSVSSSVGLRGQVDPFPLTDAKVEIRENGDLIDVLEHTQFGIYTSRQTRAEFGKLYTLNVTAPGYESVSGVAELPVVFEAPDFTVDRTSGENEEGYTNVAITINDPPEIRNYYAIELTLVETDTSDGANRQVVSRYWFETNDAVLLGFGALDGQEESFSTTYFQDDVFDGKSETINIRVLDPRFFFFEGDIAYALLLRFYVTDEHYFRFFKTAQIQEENEGNPFGEPVRIYSNMSNGFGIFAGYHVYTEVLFSSPSK